MKIKLHASTLDCWNKQYFDLQNHDGCSIRP